MERGDWEGVCACLDAGTLLRIAENGVGRLLAGGPATGALLAGLCREHAVPDEMVVTLRARLQRLAESGRAAGAPELRSDPRAMVEESLRHKGVVEEYRESLKATLKAVPELARASPRRSSGRCVPSRAGAPCRRGSSWVRPSKTCRSPVPRRGRRAAARMATSRMSGSSGRRTDGTSGPWPGGPGPVEARCARRDVSAGTWLPSSITDWLGRAGSLRSHYLPGNCRWPDAG